jgi:hypothetical protein
MKFLFFLTLLIATNASANFAVVANSSFPGESVSKSELTNIFSGSVTSFQGKKLAIHILPSTDPAAKALFDSIGLNSSQFEQGWIEKALSGQANPPKKVQTVDEMLSAIGAKDGAIGFIPADAAGKATGSVKVIAVK